MTKTKRSAGDQALLAQLGLEPMAIAARRLKRDPSRLRQLRLAGKLPDAVQIGRDWYLPVGAKLPD